MSENKRYYWLKLNENFFEDDTMQWLEEQENGKDYIIFYLKLCLKSLNDDGYLVRYVGERLIPYDVKALSKITNTSADTVAVAMKLFIEIGLISRYDTGEIYMNQINELIGSETESAKRVRKHRAKQKVVEATSESKSLHCNSDVIKSNTEIEKEKDLERERKTMSGNPTAYPYKEVIEYLNDKAGKQYRSTTQKTQSLIKARCNEGFETDDFKAVIDTKAKEWTGTDMEKYIRPETLFGTKFESYLNQQDFTNGSENDVDPLADMR